MKKRRFLVWATRGLSTLAVCSFVVSAVLLGVTPRTVYAASWNEPCDPANHEIADPEHNGKCTCDTGYHAAGGGDRLCVADTPAGPVCGNGLVESPEACDDENCNNKCDDCKNKFHLVGNSCVADATTCSNWGNIPVPNHASIDPITGVCTCNANWHWDAATSSCIQEQQGQGNCKSDAAGQDCPVDKICVPFQEIGNENEFNGKCEPCPAGTFKSGNECISLCGNGSLDTGEVCDPSVSGTIGCTSSCLCDLCGCGVALTGDTDGDGTLDCIDECPSDASKTTAGTCGCGVADTDADGDQTPDCNDLCPADSAKTAPGVCGCGVDDTDADGDQTPDCKDLCPADPAKITPGDCGCGIPEGTCGGGGGGGGGGVPVILIPVTAAGGPTEPLIIPVTGVDMAFNYALAQQLALNLGLVFSGLAMISGGLAKKSKEE